MVSCQQHTQVQCVYMYAHAHVSHALNTARTYFAMKENYVFEKIFIGGRRALHGQQGSSVCHFCWLRKERERQGLTLTTQSASG